MDDILLKYDIINLPKPLKISTITITCKTNIPFCIDKIHKYLYQDKSFYNQCSLKIWSIHKKGYVNLKIFINASLQITGCKSISDFVYILDRLFKFLKNAYHFDKEKKIFEKINFVEDENSLIFENVKDINIAMINSDFSIDNKINRENLFQYLKQNKIYAIFDPIRHACINIKYQYNEHKIVSILVFGSGKIIITGANNSDQIIKSYYFISKILETEKNIIDDIITNENKILDIMKQLQLK